jgi:hypothetical protein
MNTAMELEHDMLPAPVELNEHDLDSVSGGATPATPATVVIVGGVIVSFASLAKEIYTFVKANTAPDPAPTPTLDNRDLDLAGGY